ncbi:MAG: hypothetical protein NVS1B10_06800 [Candidatus Saccharimonadales bacterium]
MQKLKLYLMVGFPGAGKTTVAQLIADTTGAIHICSDIERHKMFRRPTHSEPESINLYNKLNTQTADWLHEGKSVVFDTNFNFYQDREKLRKIAARLGAETVIVWVTTPLKIAQDRAVNSNEKRNGYELNMTKDQFENIVRKLEQPRTNEMVMKIDGSLLDRKAFIDRLLN